MLRSRTLFLGAAVVVGGLAVAGCSRGQRVPEQRLGVNAFGSGSQSDLGGMGALGGPWSPGGAPDPFGADGGINTSLAGFGSDAAGGFPQAQNNFPFDAAIAELEMIHFRFDVAEIDPEWHPVLDAHAAWLNQNPQVHIQIEGHTDERGTEDYNISLGQRRADTIRTYLINRGVDANRISTISYGKLRPLTFGDTEEDHFLNRRGMFLVYAPGTEMAGF